MARTFASALMGLLLLPLVASAQEYPWEETINLNNEPNACAAIQRGFKRMNNGTDTTPMIRIMGTATVTPEDFHTHQWRNITTGAINDAPFDNCFVEMPSNLFDGDYPINDGTRNSVNNKGVIFFDNVDLTYACTGQTRPAVIYQSGDTWLGGRLSGSESAYSGNFTFGNTLKGHLTIRFTNECDSSKPDNTIMTRDGDNLWSSPTARMGMWVNGVQRRNAREFSLNIVGQQNDGDDVGFAYMGGLNGGSSWGRFDIQKTHVGMWFFGPVISDFNGLFMTQNDFGMLIGGPGADAGDRVDATTCVAGTDPSPGDCGAYGGAVSDLRVNNGIIEGNNYAEVAMFEGGTGINFTNTHVEVTSTATGHGFLVGAGICSGGTRDGQIGGTVADCLGGGTLNCAGTARSFGILRFQGGYIPGDKGAVGDASTPDWGGLMIGACANDSSSKVILSAELAESTISGPTPVAFQFSPTLSMPNMPQVDVTNVLRTGNFYWPAYANLFHNGAISVPFIVNAAAWTTGQYISFGGDVTAGVAASSIFAGVPLPWAHLIRYQVYHLDIGAFAAHTGNQTCNFVPVKMDYDHATLSDVTGTTAAFTGNPITAGTRFAFNYAPGSTTALDIGATNDPDKIGLRVENGSACDELFASGALTLLPLE